MLKKWYVLCVILAVCCFAVSATANNNAVTAEVKRAVDQVVKIVSNPEMKKSKNEAKRRAALKSAIGGIFDYSEMAKRSLGLHWKARSKSEQKEFVNLFASLLENSYAGKIESYENEKIVYDSENVENDYAEVRSRVLSAKRDEYSLDYKLMKEGNRWMIYDVVIEGVSLVSNYRTQFNKIIVNQGYAKLVQKLQAKNTEIKTP